MTRDDIFAMYEKANGWSPDELDKTIDELERFAKLVVAEERKQWEFKMKALYEEYSTIKKHRDTLLEARLQSIMAEK